MKGIYKITNLINNKVYIGKSGVSIENRWKSETSKGINDHFNRSVQKYGIENFKFEVLIETQENLDELEIKYIREYQSHDPKYGYNKTFGGDGVKPTEEIRKKLRDAATGVIPSKETRAKRSASMMGKNTGPKSPEHIRKNSEAHKGKHPSKEDLEKRSASMKGKNTGKKSLEHRKKLSEARKGKSPWNKGKKYSDELRKICSESHKGLKYYPVEVECPYCGKKGKGGSMKRWHFDNCRKKEIVCDI